VGDIRESPALKIVELLQARGAEVAYHDPFVPELAQLGLRHEELEDGLRDADAAVIVTAHPGVDHEAVARSAPATVDFRGVTRHMQHAPLPR
jgi:UDP-N-acetyl-D-glucosamine dehydrogenase